MNDLLWRMRGNRDEMIVNMLDTTRFPLSAVMFWALIHVLGCGAPDPEIAAPPKNVLACSQPTACGIVVAINGDPGFPPATNYDAGQSCALKELAKQVPVRLHYSDGCEGMCVGKVLLVRSDASVISQPYSQSSTDTGIDLDGISVEFNQFDGNDVCKLKPASYFDTCLAAFDPSCASESNWVTDCVPLATLSCEP
jgi:hypothetical protein